ncbi:uncharacterized protein AtWU_00864 [Aspergillus tubingensis]|uniref:uncharacterized protein n=1 Tax=Aspergillus tubingensis TaxID=5068 RepID=UPI0015779713|nr:uncharacterized protein AtWU_00864 [Aspergillus tubingensis]GFN11068.1 hypothetical protein AtWU_00864 [Aspergillus tubingensis]
MADTTDQHGTTPTRSAEATPSSINRDQPLPSVEFTFSCSPSSPECLTPNSSVDGFNSAILEGRRSSMTPTTRLLFEDLHLSDSISPAAQQSPINQSSIVHNDSGLTPTRSAHRTTYRDLHNSTPSPIGPSYIRPSQQRSPTPTSPSGDVSSHFRNLNLGDADSYVSDSDRSSTLDSEGDAAEEDDEDAYNIRHESLPQEPIYDIRLQNALRDVRGELMSLTQIMSGNALAHDNTSDLSKLYEKTREASRFAYPATRTVGFIGDSGVGKSSLINSLLDQEGLARSSGDGAACTTVVTEFRSVNDTYPENYTVVADFMDNDEIRELLEELLSSIRKYYTEAFREVRTSEEQENIKVAAKRAWDTLKSLFPHERDLDIDFLAQEGDEAVATIMSTLLEWAMAGLDTRPGGRDNLQYTVVSHHADQCMKHLDRLMANDDDGDDPALWPFVKLVRVYLRSPVLRTGLVLADLPGFRDLNYARVRATERYLRHSCDEVFIVSNIMRCTTDQSIRDIIRRCARDQPIRIVCTRSEDVNSEETARTAPAADAVRIRNMNNQIRQLDRRIVQTGTRRRKAHGSKMQSLAAEESNLRDQKETLELQLMNFLVIRRNTSVTNSLLHALGGMARIFCVSNKLYSDHREDDPRQANGYLALSGIQELRRYCQSVPADAQFRATVSYLQHEVPALLGSITQWALAGTSTMTMARAEVLRRVLTEAESSLKGSTTRDGSQVHSLQSSLRRKFSDAITQQIRRSRRDWRDDAVEASLEWANWHHMTYAAFCRNYGTYETAKQPRRCWNEEILGSGIDQLSLAWDSVLNWLEEEGKKLEDEISRIFQGVHDSIDEQRELAPETLGNLLLNLRMRRTCILDALQCSIERLIDDTENIMDDTVGGHASSYIAGVMRPVYNLCMEQRGTGSDSRRKQTMNRHLSSRSLFQDFADNITLDYEEMIDEAFEQLNQRLSEEVAHITRDLHATVTVEGEISEAGENPECTEGVKRRVETCQRALANAQATVQGLS